MSHCGYIASYSSEAGDLVAVVDLRCQQPAVAENATFRELAQAMSRLVAEYAPKYLEQRAVPSQVLAQLSQECKRQALQLGIPDQDLDSYANRLYRERLESMCLLSLPYKQQPLSHTLTELQSSLGLIYVASFYRASLAD